jgi:phosphoribosylaminoimidazole carboxylase PurK protein
MNQTQKTIGIVGGGQLGRMLTLAALPLGFKVVVLDPGKNSPAAQAGAQEITADLHDEMALRELAHRCDFITIEIEHVNTQMLETLMVGGASVNPAPESIRLIQDKFIQKQFFADGGVPVAEFSDLTGPRDGRDLLERFGGTMMLKTRRGAFDGRGNQVVNSPDELDAALRQFDGQAVYAEKLVSFTKELAVMSARSEQGEVLTYPVVETVQQRNICVEVTVPARISADQTALALELAEKVTGMLKGAGMFGIELFLAESGEILLNEVAPRVHNSGHYTMNAARTSQFEQHIRAITGLPLGDTELTTLAAAMVNILGEGNHPTELEGLAEALAIPDTFIHLYGKSPTKVDRKMGHINTTGTTVDEALTRARKARKALSL